MPPDIAAGDFAAAKKDTFGEMNQFLRSDHLAGTLFTELSGKEEIRAWNCISPARAVFPQTGGPDSNRQHLRPERNNGC